MSKYEQQADSDAASGADEEERVHRAAVTDALRVARVEGQQIAARALRRVLSQKPTLSPTALRATLETLADELDGP